MCREVQTTKRILISWRMNDEYVMINNVYTMKNDAREMKSEGTKQKTVDVSENPMKLSNATAE